MAEDKLTFQSLAAVLRDITLQQFVGSDRYRTITESFDCLLLLADRIVRACDQHPEFGRTVEIVGSLEALRPSGECNVERLVDHLEHWIKGVVRIAVPDRGAERRAADVGKNTKKYNLFGCLVDLGLATAAELNASHAEVLQFKDSVTRSIWFANVLRNRGVHDPNLSDYDTRRLITIGVCVAILAPLHLHRDAIQAALMSLITRAPGFGVATNVNKIVDSERRGHLSRFGGRDEDLKAVMERLEAARNGGYVLITAEEGTGKSALCAKVSEELKARAMKASEDVWGASAAKVTRDMSWLPGAIVHFGKSSRDPETITAFLLAQMSSMTLGLIGEPAQTAGGEEMTDGGEPDIDCERRAPGATPASKAKKSEAAAQGCITMRYRPAVRGEQLKRAIYAGLDTLVKERGEVTLIIDALEEISDEPAAFGFLPSRLPPGVAALVTSRGNTPAARWAEEHLHGARPISLQHLKRDDIPKVSGVADDTPDHKAFNNNLYAASGGLPLHVQRIMEGIDVSQPGLGDLQLVGGADQLHARQASAWTTLAPVGKWSLIALAIFEPVAPLNLELLQDFLAHKIEDVPDLSDLRGLLQPVANQIQGFDERQLKLNNRPFADYVRDRHFSKKDLVLPLTWLRKALVADSGASVSLLAAFLDVWSHESRHAEHRAIANAILDDLFALKDGRRLFGIAHHERVRENVGKEYAVRSLQLAATLEHPPALRLLGLMTFDGQVGPADPVEGRRLLELAWHKGDGKALILLGHRLIDGRGVPASPADGLAYLEEAVLKKVEDATYALGTRLLFGQGVRQDADRGARLLEQAADCGEHRAMHILGVMYLEGAFIGKDTAKGRHWLTKAAEAGNELAMVHLGDRLLDGEDFEADKDAGERWFEKACQRGSTFAMTTLSHRLFAGNAVAKDPEKAIDLLLRAAEAGDEQSMRILGMRFLEGEGVATDKRRGYAWLEKAAEAGDDVAIERMEQEHIHRLSTACERPASEEWLRHAIENVSPDKCSDLGGRLYEAEEKQLAAVAFQKSLERGCAEAGNNLFYMLRRHEASVHLADTNPHQLVDVLVEKEYAFAIVNKALAMAAGFECVEDWHAADSLMSKVVVESDSAELVEWWHALSKNDDGEGHLVLGWLARHGKIGDPEGIAAKQRLVAAQRRGWNVPDWLLAIAST